MAAKRRRLPEADPSLLDREREKALNGPALIVVCARIKSDVAGIPVHEQLVPSAPRCKTCCWPLTLWLWRHAPHWRKGPGRRRTCGVRSATGRDAHRLRQHRVGRLATSRKTTATRRRPFCHAGQARARRRRYTMNDPCCARSGPLLSIAEAEARVCADLSPVGETELVPIASAGGRVMAEPVRARVPVPTFDNACRRLCGRLRRTGRHFASRPARRSQIAASTRASSSRRPAVDRPCRRAYRRAGEPARRQYQQHRRPIPEIGRRSLPRAPISKPATGPLVGLASVFAEIAAGGGASSYVLSVSVDTPFLPFDLTARFSDALRETGTRVAFAASGGRDHPTVALWDRGAGDELRGLFDEQPEISRAG